MKLREAIYADRHGFAEARDENGKLLAIASGASWRRRPSKQRRKGDGLSIKFFFNVARTARWPASAYLGTGVVVANEPRKSISWRKLSHSQRASVNSWTWTPVTPRSAVDRLGDVARRSE